MSADRLGVVVRGSLSKGLELKLDPEVSLEALRAGMFAIARGRQYDFFSLLTDLELPLSAMDGTLLRQLARAPGGHVRRVVLLDAPAALVEHLGEAAVRISARVEHPQRPRLRDGRWVV